MYRGSGSVADLAGFETYAITKSWIVYIDKTLPPPIHFTSVGPFEGNMRLPWKKAKTRGSITTWLKSIAVTAHRAILSSSTINRKLSLTTQSLWGALLSIDCKSLQKVMSRRNRTIVSTQAIGQLDIGWEWVDEQTARVKPIITSTSVWAGERVRRKKPVC
jgi:hypothetical protein